MEHGVLPDEEGREGSVTRPPDGSGAHVFDVELTHLLSHSATPSLPPPRRIALPHLPHRARIAIGTVLVIAVALGGQLTSRNLASSTPASDRVRNPVGAATVQNVLAEEAPVAIPSAPNRDEKHGSTVGPVAIDDRQGPDQPETDVPRPPVTVKAPTRLDGAYAEAASVAGHLEPPPAPVQSDARVTLPSEAATAVAAGLSRAVAATDDFIFPILASTAPEPSRALPRDVTIAIDATASGPTALAMSLHLQADRIVSPLPIVVSAEPPGPIAGLSTPAIDLHATVRPSADPKPAPPAISLPTAAAPADRRETDLIISRARALMAGRDFRTARSLLELLVETSPEASLLLAQTFDGRYIRERRVRGVSADHPRARTLYERAAQMGLYEAEQNLRDLKD